MTTSSPAPAQPPPPKPAKPAAKANPALMMIPSSVVCPGEKERPPSPPRAVQESMTSANGGREYASRSSRADGNQQRRGSAFTGGTAAQPYRRGARRSRSASSGGSSGGSDGDGNTATHPPTPTHPFARPTCGLPGWLPAATRGRHPNVNWLAAPDEALKCETEVIDSVYSLIFLRFLLVCLLFVDRWG